MPMASTAASAIGSLTILVADDVAPRCQVIVFEKKEREASS
jgi:hypothetical protein